jgi:hypothetical protein
MKYRCACCDGEYETGWSEDQARAEARLRFGITDPTSPAVATICDDCYVIVVAESENDRTKMTQFAAWRARPLRDLERKRVMVRFPDHPWLRRGEIVGCDKSGELILVALDDGPEGTLQVAERERLYPEGSE